MEKENKKIERSVVAALGNYLQQIYEENQAIFKKWYPVYKKGNYLKYTDSLYQEIRLIDELCEEAGQVTQYKEYLQE